MTRVSYMRTGVGAVIGAALITLAPAPAAAQAPAASACLTADQRAVNDAYYSLTRPTSRDDQMPFFDPEYFAGTWNFESRVVDSPLGPGGESIGTLTIKSTAPCQYEGELKAEDPDGKPFTRKIKYTYDTAKKHLTWAEVDSRGYTLTKSGVVGGELGGLFHHHFEDAPEITFGGRKVRVTGVSEMSSPAYYKSDFKISIDGAPAITFGRASFEKQLDK